MEDDNESGQNSNQNNQPKGPQSAAQIQKKIENKIAGARSKLFEEQLEKLLRVLEAQDEAARGTREEMNILITNYEKRL